MLRNFILVLMSIGVMLVFFMAWEASKDVIEFIQVSAVLIVGSVIWLLITRNQFIYIAIIVSSFVVLMDKLFNNSQSWNDTLEFIGVAISIAIVSAILEKTVRYAFTPVKKKKEDINKALVVECVSGDIKRVKYLLRKGADVNTFDAYTEYHTPLYEACRIGNCEIVKLLIKKGADVNENGQLTYNEEQKIYYADLQKYYKHIYENSPVSAAIESADLETVKYLVEHGVDFRNMNEEKADHFLTLASKSGNSILVKYLLNQGLDSQTVKNKALGGAIRNKDYKTTKLLLENSAEIEQKELRWYLHYLEFDTDLDILKLLVEYGANIKEYLDSFSNVVFRSEAKTLEYLKEIGININDIIADWNESRKAEYFTKKAEYFATQAEYTAKQIALFDDEIKQFEIELNK